MTRARPALLESRGGDGGRGSSTHPLRSADRQRGGGSGLPFPLSLLPFFFSSVVVRTKGAIIEETRQPGRKRRSQAGRQAGGAFLPPPLFVSPPFRILNSHCTGPRQPSAPRFLYIPFQRPYVQALTLAPATYSSGPSQRPCNCNMPL